MNINIDPLGTVPAAGVYRVVRGGSWSHGARFGGAAYRNYDAPGSRYGSIGFRLAVTLPCKTTTPVVQ